MPDYPRIALAVTVGAVNFFCPWLRSSALEYLVAGDTSLNVSGNGPVPLEVDAPSVPPGPAAGTLGTSAGLGMHLPPQGVRRGKGFTDLHPVDFQDIGVASGAQGPLGPFRDVGASVEFTDAPAAKSSIDA